jgi:hypothetical protein
MQDLPRLGRESLPSGRSVLPGEQYSEIETVWETENYKLEIEYTPLPDGHEAKTVHFEVFSWLPSSLRQMKRDWAIFRPTVEGPLFAANEDEDEKWLKFIASFGFVYLMDVIGTNGAHRRLFVNLN